MEAWERKWAEEKVLCDGEKAEDRGDDLPYGMASC